MLCSEGPPYTCREGEGRQKIKSGEGERGKERKRTDRNEGNSHVEKKVKDQKEAHIYYDKRKRNGEREREEHSNSVHTAEAFYLREPLLHQALAVVVRLDRLEEPRSGSKGIGRKERETGQR